MELCHRQVTGGLCLRSRLRKMLGQDPSQQVLRLPLFQSHYQDSTSCGNVFRGCQMLVLKDT
jgi:hypothetical protein